MTTSSNSHELNSLAAGPTPLQRMPARRRARGRRHRPVAHGRRRAVMSKRHIEECIRDSLETYFKDLRGVEPTSMYEMIMNVVEKPLLDVVMKHAEGNQSRAAEWLGINRNTLRRKLVEHKLIK
jgi:Fis family transcriptional regulator